MVASAAKKLKTGRFKVQKGVARKRISLNEDLYTGKKSCKIISVNIPGIRALLKNPERRAFLKNLILDEDPDIFMLQEHKLQEMHLEKEKNIQSFLDTEVKEYTAYWSFSTAKKGYSGVATFVKQDFARDNPVRTVRKKLIEDGHIFDNEGRVIILEFDKFYLYNLYVPNSGQKLQRLKDRTENWDEVLLKSYKSLDKPLVSLGDMNVAFRIEDMHNFYHKGNLDMACGMNICEEQYKGVRNLLKLSGCTIEERKSFKTILDDGCVADSYIHFNNDIQGCFTYWSMRSNNRPFNQGLRLDYTLVSPELLKEGEQPQIVDAFHLDDIDSDGWGLSDHCPIGCILLLD